MLTLDSAMSKDRSFFEVSQKLRPNDKTPMTYFIILKNHKKYKKNNIIEIEFRSIQRNW